MGWALIVFLLLLYVDHDAAEKRRKLLNAIKDLNEQVEKHERRWETEKRAGRAWWREGD
jgi:hypothetical protein